MKIYSKVGSRNYKEKKMLKHLDEVFAKKIADDPSFKSKIIPATNQKELQSMFDKYSEIDVEFTETKPNNIKSTDNAQKQPEMAKKKSEDNEDVEFEEKVSNNKFDTKIDVGDDNSFVDPFNRENPIVREYVMGRDALGRERTSGDDTRTTFDEPTSFKEAFEIPTYDEDGVEAFDD